MKQTMQQTAVQRAMQQTAVQRAMQPIARPIPTGLEQFDMAAGEEASALGVQVDEAAASYARHEERVKRSRRRLVSISEEELAAPGQIDDMMASRSAAAAAAGADAGSAAASSSGYAAGTVAATDSGHISDTATVPIKPRTDAFEELTTNNLRGTSRVWVGGHTRKDSTGSTISAESARTAASTATTVAMPQKEVPSDIDQLIEVARVRRRILNLRQSDEEVQLSMEISDLIYQIEKLRNSPKYINLSIQAAYKKAKLRLMEIMEMPEPV